MTGSRAKCPRTHLSLDSIKACVSAARSLSSFSCSDEAVSHSHTLEDRRSQDLHECTHRLSASLKSLSASSSSSLSDVRTAHSHTRDSATLDCTRSHGWRRSALTEQRDIYYWPPPSSSSSALLRSGEESHRSQSRVSRPRAEKTISVFWDLDNKPPHSVPPYEAAIRLREVASSFGRLVDMVAYANRHAFSYLPSWVKDERRQRKELDRLEVSGLAVPAEPYVCGYCGRKCRTNMALKKHFKQLHERERNKRLNRLDSLKGKKKIKYKQSLIEKETRYREASKDVIAPKVGYGLMHELRRAGVGVKMVSDRPQAADEALMQHISQSIHMGIKCICLVSDDSDFIPVLNEARARLLHTVVVGDRPRLKMYADVQFSWADLASGRAFDKAIELATTWYGKEKLGESSSQMRSTLCGNMDVGEEAMYVRTHSRDFEEWDVSDTSDVESGDVSDADSKDKSSSVLWLDDNFDDVDGDDTAVVTDDEDDDIGVAP